MTYQDGVTPLTNMANGSLETTGFNTSHQNMQPYLTLNFCIAIDGLFPQRS